MRVMALSTRSHHSPAGNIKPLLALNYPNCLGHQQPYSCSQSAADSATYVEVGAVGWFVFLL